MPHRLRLPASVRKLRRLKTMLIADAEEQWAILHDSGAWARNLERWPSVSTTGSLDYFKKTVRSREAWMEEYLASLP